MPSRLYTEARNSLSRTETRQVEDFQSWLSACAEPAFDGARVALNLQEEAHLVGDDGFGVPSELAAFLRECGAAHAKASSKSNRRAALRAACSRFELRGLNVERAHLPPRLLRYSANVNLAASLIERVLGKSARLNFENGTLSPADAFKQMARRWKFSMKAPERLSGALAVFATFDHPGGAPRNDAARLANAMALPAILRAGTGDQMLFEFAYDRDSVRGHRFPTVADAGDFHLFLPAAEIPPDPSVPQSLCGWTKPLGGEPCQPEIVHENATFDIVKDAPRFVGSL
jgi:hypothetical protein